MEQEGHSVTIKRTRGDYFTLLRQATKHMRNIQIYYLVAAACIVIVINAGLDVLGCKHLLLQNTGAMYALTIGAMLAIILLLRKLFNVRLRREYLNENQSFLSQKRVTIDETGFREKSAVAETFVLWQGVDRIEKTQDMLLVYVDKISAFCIPVRNFISPQLAEQFYENMLAYWRQAHNRPVPDNA